MKLPQLVVFDLAGTTVKDEQYVHKILQEVMAQNGVAITLKEANEVMGIPKPVAIRQLLVQRDLPVNTAIIENLHRAFVLSMIDFYNTQSGIEEIVGTTKVFQALRQKNVKIAVDTGFDRAITDPLLERMNWTKMGLLDASVTSDEVEYGRPHPDLIYKAMERVGVTEVAAVMKVGDTPSDMQEGSAAGCGWVVGITGNFSRLRLEQEPHTHVIHQLEEILTLLDLAD